MKSVNIYTKYRRKLLWFYL